MKAGGGGGGDGCAQGWREQSVRADGSETTGARGGGWHGHLGPKGAGTGVLLHQRLGEQPSLPHSHLPKAELMAGERDCKRAGLSLQIMGRGTGRGWEGLR